MGPLWNVQRSDTQWDELSPKKIFALNTGATIEFIPQTQGMDEKLGVILMKMAEKHKQISEEDTVGLVKEFQNFLNSLREICPVVSFDEFIESKLYDDLMKDEEPAAGEDHDTLYDDQLDVYEADDDIYTKRARYH